MQPLRVAEFARAALELGVSYLGLCCGAAPHHIRAMAEAMGRRPPASRYSPDMSKHAYLGSDPSLQVENLAFAERLVAVYRYAVIGGGGIGSAAAYWLSRRAGERGAVPRAVASSGTGSGASEDHSRIIRLGYHSTAYTALTRDAYAAWREVEAESGVPLVHTTGMVNLARRGSEGARDPRRLHRRRWTRTASGRSASTRAELMRRWPQFRVPEDHEALYQPDGGILDIRKAGAVHVALARARGATVLGGARVTAIEPGADRRAAADRAPASSTPSTSCCARARGRAGCCGGSASTGRSG